MKIRLLMLVDREAQGRLTGVIFQEGQFTPGCFARAPELKVMEEALPAERAPVESARGTGPGSAPEPARG